MVENLGVFGSGESIAEDHIQFAGDYRLDSIKIISYDGKPVDIKAMVQEFNIYESIYKNAITGSLVIADAQNLIKKMPLQGTERLEFKLFTPGANSSVLGTIDAREKTGHPFYIYKLANRRQISEGLILYVLHFCSREMLRSVRTRVSQAYTGPLHESAAKIFTDHGYLDSRKKLFVEPTRNSDTIVIPNMRPLDAISMLASRSLSGNAKGAGYFFYETTKGYYFRSFENMVSQQGKHARQPVANFDYKVRRKAKIANPHGTEPETMSEELEAVEAYEFINSYDSAEHQAMGTYGHTVITHNIYDKTFDIARFKYHPNFNDLMHTDSIARGDYGKYLIPKVPVDLDGENTVSDYTESKITLQGTTQFSHGKSTGSFGIDPTLDGETEAIKTSHLNSIIKGIVVKLTVAGQSYIEPGDVITFSLRSVEPEGRTEAGGLDPQYPGRYVVSKIRHRITDQVYKMVLECVKDSVYTGYGTHNEQKWPGTTRPQEGQVINIYDIDSKTAVKPAMLSPTSGQIHMAGDR